jgi:hypothetical protein
MIGCEESIQSKNEILRVHTSALMSGQLLAGSLHRAGSTVGESDIRAGHDKYNHFTAATT